MEKFKVNSAQNQEIKRKLVDREVYANVNSMVNYTLQKGFEDNKAPFTLDDVENLFIYPEYIGEYAEFKGGTEEKRQKEIERLEQLKEEAERKVHPAGPSNLTAEEEKEYHYKFDKISEEIEDLENLEEEQQEIFEWYLVSGWLLNKLKELCEPVIEGENIWGRTCTGQAVMLDGTISKIAYDLGILEGQENEWKV